MPISKQVSELHRSTKSDRPMTKRGDRLTDLPDSMQKQALD